MTGLPWVVRGVGVPRRRRTGCRVGASSCAGGGGGSPRRAQCRETCSARPLSGFFDCALRENWWGIIGRGRGWGEVAPLPKGWSGAGGRGCRESPRPGGPHQGGPRHWWTRHRGEGAGGLLVDRHLLSGDEALDCLHGPVHDCDPDGGGLPADRQGQGGLAWFQSRPDARRDSAQTRKPGAWDKTWKR